MAGRLIPVASTASAQVDKACTLVAPADTLRSPLHAAGLWRKGQAMKRQVSRRRCGRILAAATATTLTGWGLPSAGAGLVVDLRVSGSSNPGDVVTPKSVSQATPGS